MVSHIIRININVILLFVVVVNHVVTNTKQRMTVDGSIVHNERSSRVNCPHLNIRGCHVTIVVFNSFTGVKQFIGSASNGKISLHDLFVVLFIVLFVKFLQVLINRIIRLALFFVVLELNRFTQHIADSHISYELSKARSNPVVCSVHLFLVVNPVMNIIIAQVVAL